MTIEKGKVTVSLSQESIDALIDSDLLNINGIEFVKKPLAIEMLNKFGLEQSMPYILEVERLRRIIMDAFNSLSDVDIDTLEDKETRYFYVNVIDHLLEQFKKELI